MICGHVPFWHCAWWFDQVPLSCVPPWTSQGCCGLIDTPTNWSVEDRLRLTCLITVGTRESSRLQLLRLAGPSSGRSPWLQRDEMSAKLPFVRITPPSDPSKI